MERKFLKTFFLALFGALFAINSWAAPAIISVSGTFDHKNSITISGSGFGVKSPAKPYLWAPFEGSINPSPLGTITSWSTTENMSYSPNEGVGGTGGAKASNSSGIWTLGVAASGFAWNDLNQQMYLFRKTKRNFDITSDLNWKVYRLWATGYSTPDFYISPANGAMTVEGIGSGGWMNTSIGRGPKDSFFTEELILKSNSDLNKADAVFYFIVNGQEAGRFPYTDYSTKTLQLKSQNYQTGMTINFPVHGVKANITFPSDYRFWADDVYLDKTWARVMIGNSSTWGGCTQKDPQIPSAWNSSNIAVTVNTGSFSIGQKAYLYVVDSNGQVNSNGYPVTIGTSSASATPTTPPTGTAPPAPALNPPVVK